MLYCKISCLLHDWHTHLKNQHILIILVEIISPLYLSLEKQVGLIT